MGDLEKQETYLDFLQKKKEKTQNKVKKKVRGASLNVKWKNISWKNKPRK